MLNKKVLKLLRHLHHSSLAILSVFFMLIIITGVLLSWKKNSNGYLLPETKTSEILNSKAWLSADSLIFIAQTAYFEYFEAPPAGIDRIDIRPTKGIAKVTFINSYYEVQLDGKTGNVLNFGKRRSDFIEDLHDGSILDTLLGFKNNTGKLIYGSLVGTSLLFYTTTGLILWLYRKQKKRNRRI